MGLNERLKDLAESRAETSCTSIVRKHIDAIEQAINNRVTIQSLVDAINKEFDTNISVGSFKTALARYRKARKEMLADNTNSQDKVEATNAVEQQTTAQITAPQQKSKRFDWAAAKRDAPKTLE